MDAIRIGVLVPLSRPGWVEAGRQLLGGMESAVRELNAAGGAAGRPVELLVRDTAADPERAAAAVGELAGLQVDALAGEFHSVAARAAAARAEQAGVPFLCSSAVLDALTEQPTDLVARLAPAQSHGWRVYADFLLGAGHRRVAVVTQGGAYWESGTRILRERLAAHGGDVVELDPVGVPDALAASGASAVLLLTGFPDPAVPIVRAVRRDPRLADVLIGAPAGQPEFTEWASLLGPDGAGVPFLRYLPERLDPVGARVAAVLREDFGREPSFVAFEGWDTVNVLAAMLGSGEAEWSRVQLAGTRGPIRFERVPGIGVWQWAWAPVQVADRDPADPGRWRVLHTG
ncbi:ABC transporter substrate-binding protein [Kitasatospora sp. CB01950]|uniref:ABC transporter substrate-binding protein n=1 Tax=Kitasatospora sp. CB01950 TaxID=1703930 RepID=UPI00093C3B2B|nr:ABC transporter substrate-binding protein [Kitasatospora sp. CB01950]OKJ15675.1 amino acid ABC transporter substrate-binding protein [Kitasatospora sp. CB01950]